MAERVRLYTGTEQGLSVWREGATGWETVGSGIPAEPCRAIAGSRERPGHVFAGVEHDGIYRTDDGGQRWAKVFDGDIWSIERDPTDERVIYAGTAPVHLYRSEDEGQRWEEITGLQHLPEEIKARQVYPVLNEQSHVLGIFIDPENPTSLLLALEHGGIIRSRDRGESWDDVTSGIDYVDIHMVGKLPKRECYYAATARGFFATADPATEWVRAENGFTRDYFYKFIILPPTRGESDPTMLISTTDKSPGSYLGRPGHARGAIFRSRDCGTSWHRIGVERGLPEVMEERAWTFVAHPHDPNAVFTGLGRYPYPQSNFDTGLGAVAVTRDRGDSWERLDIPVKPVWGLWAAPEE